TRQSPLGPSPPARRLLLLTRILRRRGGARITQHGSKPTRPHAPQPTRRTPHARLGASRPASTRELHPPQPRLRPRHPHPRTAPRQALRGQHFTRPRLDNAASRNRGTRAHRARPRRPHRESRHPCAHGRHRPIAKRHSRERPHRPQPHPRAQTRQRRPRPPRLGRPQAPALARATFLHLPTLRLGLPARPARQVHPRRCAPRHDRTCHRTRPTRRHLRSPVIAHQQSLHRSRCPPPVRPKRR